MIKIDLILINYTKPLTCILRINYWRCPRILQTLINTHDMQASSLDHMNKLSEVRYRAWIQIMHHDQVPSTSEVSSECIELAFGRVRCCP